MNDETARRVALLTARSKSRGFVLYGEIDQLVPEDYSGGPEVNEIFAELARTHLEIRDDPEPAAEVETVEDFSDSEDAIYGQDPVKIYLREVRKVPRLTHEREIALSRRIRACGADAPAAKKELIEANLHLVISIARRCPETGHHLLDVIQAGNMGLMKAADEFDPERGYPFSNNVTFWARRAMREIPPGLGPSNYPHNQIQ